MVFQPGMRLGWPSGKDITTFSVSIGLRHRLDRNPAAKKTWVEPAYVFSFSDKDISQKRISRVAPLRLLLVAPKNPLPAVGLAPVLCFSLLRDHQPAVAQQAVDLGLGAAEAHVLGHRVLGAERLEHVLAERFGRGPVEDALLLEGS